MPALSSKKAYELGSADALAKFAFLGSAGIPLAQRIANAIIQGGTGVAMNLAMAPHGDKMRQGLISALSDGAGGFVGGVPGMFLSPVINMSLQGATAPRPQLPEDAEYDFSQKQADHADDRLQERVQGQLPPDALEQLRAQIKGMQLYPGRYYLTLNDVVGNPAGVAAFKTVGPDNQLVLSTVLNQAPNNASSLSHLLKQPIGKVVGKADATPKQYTLRRRDDGAYTCSCKDYRYRQAALGGECKHIKAHKAKEKLGDPETPPMLG